MKSPHFRPVRVELDGGEVLRVGGIASRCAAAAAGTAAIAAAVVPAVEGASHEDDGAVEANFRGRENGVFVLGSRLQRVWFSRVRSTGPIGNSSSSGRLT